MPDQQLASLRQPGLTPSAAAFDQPLSDDPLEGGQLLAHRRRGEVQDVGSGPQGAVFCDGQEDPEMADLEILP
jgi:hypothetical protein